MSSVSTHFRSIADSDQVWANFLPPGCENWIPHISPKKSLYRHLCDHPVPIDGRNVSLSLDKKSGKKCFMLGARDLAIAWGDDRNYWEWIAMPESRFNEVAQLLYVWWLHIIGRIETFMLSSETNYVAYFVFQFNGHQDGFDQPVKSHVCIDNDDYDEGQSVTLDPEEGEPSVICERADRWMESKMGSSTIKMEMMEHWCAVSGRLSDARAVSLLKGSNLDLLKSSRSQDEHASFCRADVVIARSSHLGVYLYRQYTLPALESKLIYVKNSK